MLILGDNMMKTKKTYKKIIAISILLLITHTIVIPTSAEQQTIGPQLEITAINGGLGKICIQIQNTGDEIAEEIVSTIHVTGGLFNQINVYKECSGCGQCNTSLPPGEIKTECIDQFLLGIGSIHIIATVNASEVPTVEETASGFIIGPFVLL